MAAVSASVSPVTFWGVGRMPQRHSSAALVIGWCHGRNHFPVFIQGSLFYTSSQFYAFLFYFFFL